MGMQMERSPPNSNRERSSSLKKKKSRDQSPKRVQFEEEVGKKSRSPSPKAKSKGSKKYPQSSKRPNSVEEKLLMSLKVAESSEVELLELLGAPAAMKRRARSRSKSPQRVQTDKKRSRSPKAETRKHSASPRKNNSEEDRLLQSLDLSGVSNADLMNLLDGPKALKKIESRSDAESRKMMNELSALKRENAKLKKEQKKMRKYVKKVLDDKKSD